MKNDKFHFVALPLSATPFKPTAWPFWALLPRAILLFIKLITKASASTRERKQTSAATVQHPGSPALGGFAAWFDIEKLLLFMK